MKYKVTPNRGFVFLFKYMLAYKKRDCKHRLHNFCIREHLCKLGHILQIPNRIACCVRQLHPNICCKILNELVAPFLMVIDDTTNTMVEHDQFCIDMNSRFILSQFDFLPDLLNRRKVSLEFNSTRSSPFDHL